MEIGPQHIGNLLVVEFLDHTENNRAALTRVPGFLKSLDGEALVLEVWQTLNISGDIAGVTQFCIVRATIRRAFVIPNEMWGGVAAEVKEKASTETPTVKIGETEYGVAESRPAGSPGQLAAGEKALRKVYGLARGQDTNIPPLDIEKWSRAIFRSEATPFLAMERIGSLKGEDFRRAFGAFLERKNKKQLWSPAWIENARTVRLALPGEEASRKHRAEARKPGANPALQQAAGKIGITLEDEAHMAWFRLSREERQKRASYANKQLGGSLAHETANATARGRFVKGWLEKHEKETGTETKQ